MSESYLTGRKVDNNPFEKHSNAAVLDNADSVDKTIPQSWNLLDITADRRLAQNEVTDSSLSGRYALYAHPQNPLLDINADSIVQGDLNDCYFLAPLAGFAMQSPELIKDMITDNKDGSCTVVFPGDQSKPKKQIKVYAAEVKKFVDTLEKADENTGRKENRYIDKDRHIANGTWAKVIEIAFEKLTYGVNEWPNQKETGGKAYLAMDLLTNKEVTWKLPQGYSSKHFDSPPAQMISDSDLERLLSQMISDKRIIVAFNAENTKTSEDSKPSTKLIKGHDYTVVRYDKVDQTVWLRDPYGSECNNGTQTGRFRMSLSDFSKQFGIITYTK